MLGTLRYGDFGLRTTAGRALSFVCSTGLGRAKYRKLKLHYRHKTTREEAERETTRKDFLVFMFGSEKCKYFACDLNFRIMNKFFHTSGSNFVG